MIVSLTGFMGSGKSSVGKELGKLLSCPAVDLDDMVESLEKEKIPDIFKNHGEAYFRDVELAALGAILMNAESTPAGIMSVMAIINGIPDGSAPGGNDAAASTSPGRSSAADGHDTPTLILALGGGTLTTPACAELVRRKTVCVYLRATVDTLVSILESNKSGRPMLQGDEPLRQRVERLMAGRASTYESVARHVVDIDDKSFPALALEISSILNR